MKVSVNAIRYINEREGSAGDPAPKGVADLASKIGAQLGAIEEVVDFGKRFSGVVVAKVISCEPHPNADKLKVCKIDDGGKVRGAKRDAGRLVQVVCAAPNVKAGMLVAWLPPGVAMPETIDKEPLVVDVRELRGQLSNGMLASPRELGLRDWHGGILEIDQPATPGMSFGDVYHITKDVILDIENKMFTHRPDCFGWLGIAREIEGIYGRKYKSPKWYTTNPKFSGIETEQLKLEVKNEIPKLVRRFTAIAVRGVQVGPSPVWLQVNLARMGIRSINNIVDYTNWFMVLTGQPIHIYDYDKVRALSGSEHATMVVRHPKKGETVTILGGKTIEPHPDDMMVATDKQLICVGGAIGGANSEVDENTSNIIIEAANWDMYAMRRTSMAHGIFTDAVTRFTKGQSPLQNLAALAKITSQICKDAHGKVASPVIDINHLPKAVRERRSLHPPVRLNADFINTRLGLRLTKQEIAKLLTNVEFDVAIIGNDISVTAPFWRTDIEIPEDVVEEVGRLYGYDKLPLELPKHDLTPAPKNADLELKSNLRDRLSAAGANEVLTYSFVHSDLFKKTGQDSEHAFRISNALSPDLQYYRTGLTPSLLDKVHANIKAGYSSFALYELNKVHYKGEMDADQPNVPNEDSHLALVVAFDDRRAPQGAAYYQARKYLELAVDLDATKLVPLAEFDLAKDEWGKQLTAPYEPRRSAVMVRDDQIWGVIGEFRASVRQALKLPSYTAGFEVNMDVVAKAEATYEPLSRFPRIEQDICLRVAAGMPYQQLHDFAWQQLYKIKPENTQLSLSPVDIYQRKGDDTHKQITLRISIVSFERTLTDAEVATLLDTLAAAAKEKLAGQKV